MDKIRSDGRVKKGGLIKREIKLGMYLGIGNAVLEKYFRSTGQCYREKHDGINGYIGRFQGNKIGGRGSKERRGRVTGEVIRGKYSVAKKRMEKEGTVKVEVSEWNDVEKLYRKKTNNCTNMNELSREIAFH